MVTSVKVFMIDGTDGRGIAMREQMGANRLFSFAVKFCCLLILFGDYFVAPGQTAGRAGSKTDISLRTFLQDYHRKKAGEEVLTRFIPKTRYLAASIDLNNDRIAETIVYFSSGGLCGSGGCVALVLQRTGQRYDVIAEVTIVHLPIRALDRRSNGWKSLAVRVAGGEITDPYEAILEFDGRRYPTNPSTPPARKLVGSSPGFVLLRSSKGAELLFP